MLVLAVTAGLVVMGRMALDRPQLALAIAAVVMVAALASTDPPAVAVLALLGVWLVVRARAGPVDLSASDAILIVASAVAVPFVPWDCVPLRRVLAAVVVFEAILLVTVLVHPAPAALVEWGHRLFLTGGSVVVGAALASRNRAAGALSAFLVVATGVALVAVAGAATSGFQPAAVLGFHKNFIGSMMLVALVVGHLAGSSTSLSPMQLAVVKTVCAGGLLASQSRGAIVSLVAVLIVAAARSAEIRRRSLPLFAILVPLAIFAFLSLESQVETPSGDVHTSVTERGRYRDQGLEAWRASPIVGQGMRFFESGRFSLQSDPHNVIVASLSETGVVGLVALVGLLGVALGVTWRLASGLALAAACVLLARFIHGLFDIYWVAGTKALPWMIVGMAVAERAGSDRGAGSDRRAPAVAVLNDCGRRDG